MLRTLKRLLARAAIDPAQLGLPFLGPVAPAPRVGDVPPSTPGAPQPAGPRRAPPLEEPARVPPARRRRTAAEQDEAAARKLSARHAELNAERFGGTLRPIRIEVSRRLRSRLGYYRLVSPRHTSLIVISRRHLRRHGWDEACDTLLHEMVHQWQDENGLPVDHGARFRAKAREVGAVPRARRPVG